MKKTVTTIISLVMCVTLTACTLPGFMQDIADDISYLLDDSPEEEYALPKPVDEDDYAFDNGIEVSEEVIELDDDEPDPDDSAQSGDEDGSLDRVLKDERYFAYHTLKEGEQKMYKMIYTSLFDFGSRISMPTRDPAMIDKVFNCVLADNPELFYVRGYNLIRFERGGNVEQLSISGIYTMTRAEAKEHQEKADRYVDECLANAPSGTDDYEVIKYLYEYIIGHTEYDLNAPNGQNYLSVFENGRSVCQGYASAMQYMMTKRGLLCTIVRGVTGDNENHAWNLVKADGEYYHIDVTWGDMSYDLSSESDLSSLPELPEISYEYLCVTTDSIEQSHTTDNPFPIPVCTSMADNYYVREGNYFETVDKEQLMRVFDKAYDSGMTMVSVKCSDEQVYSAMTDHLMGDGHVFDYLRGAGNVNYVTLNNLNELIFYL
ncbi:MAG: hypothetical protein K6F34_05375 [Lachnospiraceae bacterium]|nr:hypothetical protein [Lachnospiraceae bacterium]